MKFIISIVAIAIMTTSVNAQDGFHQFVVKDLSGNDFSFEQLKGKKVLIVNTASKCGFTPQYKELQELYDAYKDKNFIIVGFPANNFANQEPGSEEEIMEFCSINYGVTFPMMGKISVKGDDIHPLYQWLTQKEKNGKEDSSVKWNFQKYLVDENGRLVAHFSSRTKPLDKEIVDLLN